MEPAEYAKAALALLEEGAQVASSGPVDRDIMANYRHGSPAPESEPVPANEDDGDEADDDKDSTRIKVEPVDESENNDNDAVANMNPNNQYGVGQQAQGGIQPRAPALDGDVRRAVRDVLIHNLIAQGGLNSCDGSPFDPGSETASIVHEAARRTSTYLGSVLSHEMQGLQRRLAGYQQGQNQAGGALVPGGPAAMPLGPNPGPVAGLLLPPPSRSPPPAPPPAFVPVVQAPVQAQPVAQGGVGYNNHVGADGIIVNQPPAIQAPAINPLAANPPAANQPQPSQQQGQAITPRWAPAPGEEYNSSNRYTTVCPECGENLKAVSMKSHILREHRDEHARYYGVDAPSFARCDVPGCTHPGFSRREDIPDHKLKVHGIENPAQRLDICKLRRMKTAFLTTRLSSEAAALNDLQTRIHNAEARLAEVDPSYDSVHGLDASPRAVNTNVTGDKAKVKREQLAEKLLNVRSEADQVGTLRSGDQGGWEDIATELEQLVDSLSQN